MAFAWLRQLIGGRSYRIARLANDRLDLASTLRKNGDALRALAVAREGLELLRNPVVIRQRPFEFTVLFGLTTNAEELAQQLGQPGAERQDLEDTLALLSELQAVLERLPNLRKRQPSVGAELSEKWIPYLSQRLAEPPDG